MPRSDGRAKEPFRDAFAATRKAEADDFVWRSRRYHTRRAHDAVPREQASGRTLHFGHVSED